MTDYNKLTVANLRQVLKERGIPSTGLTRKADIVKKLEEHDEYNATPAEEEVEESTAQVEPEVQSDQAVVEPQDDAAPNEIVAASKTATAVPELPEPTPAEPIEVSQIAETTVAEEPKAPVDVESQCGVALADGRFCARSLKCKSHSMGLKRAVPGRSLPYDMLLAQYQKENQAEQQRNAMETEQSATEIIGDSLLVPFASEEHILPASEEHATVVPASIESTSAEPALEPVESTQLTELQTQTQDFAMPNITPSPAPNERPTVEDTESLPVPERSISSSIEPSRMNTEERELDSRKRKRRSHSPSVSTQDIKAKKPRQSGEVAPKVHLKEDEGVVMEQRQPEEEVVDTQNESLKEDASDSQVPLPTPEASHIDGKAAPERPKAVTERKEKGDRYKDLLQPAEPATSTDALSDDRPIVPALHPATPAVYIRDFMRPLRLEPLRAHLISLASPPSASPDASILKSLFIDSMKTHALVLFSSTTAASRVRASLHGSIWPPEGQRKELWVDFIPEDKVEAWIQEEEDAITAEKDARSAGRPISAKRFEVVYPASEDGGVHAVFQEIGSSAPFNAPKGPRGTTERRKESHQALQPTTDQDTKRDLGKSFQTLDQLFDSTAAKPKLYFLAVDDETADRRLDDLRDETARDWNPEDKVRGRGRDRVDQKWQYSFDEKDRVIQVGDDLGPWADDHGGRGGRGGRGGFRSERGGGFRSERGGGFRSERGGGFRSERGGGGGGFRGRWS